ncbi:SRPBCC family protein [Telmatocola sphagniphila]
MILENLSGVLATGRELISSRFFDFPRELVFEAWKDPDHIIHWWGPNGFTNTFEEFDFRIGGHWRFVMHGPNGANFQNHIIFTDILEPEKIEFDHVSLPYFQVMVNFEESNGKTKVTFRQTFKTLEECQRLRSIAVPANEQNFDRLNAELTKMT